MPSAGHHLQQEAAEDARGRPGVSGACAAAITSLRPPACASRIRVAPVRRSSDAAAARRRDPPHRVREVAVEAREEAEAVLGRAGRRGRSVPEPGTGRLRALPPGMSRASRTTTSKPRSASSCAAVSPATPPPRIATSSSWADAIRSSACASAATCSCLGAVAAALLVASWRSPPRRRFPTGRPRPRRRATPPQRERDLFGGSLEPRVRYRTRSFTPTLSFVAGDSEWLVPRRVADDSARARAPRAAAVGPAASCRRGPRWSSRAVRGDRPALAADHADPVGLYRFRSSTPISWSPAPSR